MIWKQYFDFFNFAENCSWRFSPARLAGQNKADMHEKSVSIYEDNNTLPGLFKLVLINQNIFAAVQRENRYTSELTDAEKKNHLWRVREKRARSSSTNLVRKQVFFRCANKQPAEANALYFVAFYRYTQNMILFTQKKGFSVLKLRRVLYRI